MTDDGFVFGDDSDGDENTDDDESLFGTSSAESSETTTETDRRFGTTDDTDSESFGQRVRTAASGSTIRTAATVALAVVLVAALGVVGYPLVMGALDGSDGSGVAEPTTAGDGEFASSTDSSPTVRTTSETTASTTETTETAMPTTTQTTPPSPTPTEQTTTAIPTRGFPAGEPADENETDDSG